MFQKLRKLAQGLAEGLAEALFFIALALRAFKFWKRDSPIVSVADLVGFTETRAKYATQTTLFGYIKTRSGTQYSRLFQNELYAQSINIAKWEIYLAALGDLAVYTTANIGMKTAASEAEMRSLSAHLVDQILLNEPEVPKDRSGGFDDVRPKFEVRAGTVAWKTCATGEAAFNRSIDALVEWAPISDELKKYDVQIVKNSLRFKWKTVRDQFEPLLDSEAVINDWRSIYKERETGEGKTATTTQPA